MTWKEIALLAALGTATIVGASSCQHPLPLPNPPTSADGSAPSDGGATCSSACENIFALGCADKPTKCIDACENVQASGVFAYDVGCMTAATTCAGVDACVKGP